MAAYEVLLLNTAVPQIQAAQAGDTYVVPRDIAFSAVASFAAGTALLPSIARAGDLNTGFWFPAADTIAASTGGSETMRITSAGSVGIGTSSPGALLDVSGSTILGSTSFGTGSTVTVNNSVGGVGEALTIKNGAASIAGRGNTIRFQSSTTDIAKIRAVTVTDSTSGSLTFQTSSSGTLADRVSIGATEAVFNDPGNDYDFRVESNTNTHALFVQGSDGFVGIGTSSPATNLVVSASVNPIFRLNNSTNTINTGEDIGEIQFYTNDTSTNGTGVKAFIKTVAGAFGSAQGAAALAFGTTNNAEGNATERLRIDRAGVLFLGNGETAASPANGVFSATGGTGTDIAGASLTIRGGASTGSGAGGPIIFSTAAAGAAGTTVRSATERMRIDSAGDVGIGTSSPRGQIDVRNASGTSGLIVTRGATTASPSIGLKCDSTKSFVESYGELVLSTDVLSGTPVERVRVTTVGNVSIGGTADRATTVGTKALNIFNGTAPVGTLANGISLYSSSGEAYVMDAAGNATLFSPHDAETNEWIFKSKHTPSGKVLKIDVEKMLRFINDHFGLDAIHEFTEE